MGNPIRDIHSPSVQSGPSGLSNGTVENKDHRTLQQLIADKDAVESELRALGSVLDSHGVNMNTGLTTFDGFPRSDIDVAQVRSTRARIIHLRNDYKALMSRIERGLHEFHADQQRSAGIVPVPSATSNNGTDPTTANSTTWADEVPFAKVNSVAPNSPAATAGLIEGDLIWKFGDATWLNHEKLSKIAQIVSRSEGRAIPVCIQRNDALHGTRSTINLTLVPRLGWGGRGTLGCHLVPM